MPTPSVTGTPVASVYPNPISVTRGAGSDIYGLFGVRTTQGGPPAAVTSTWGADAMTPLTQGTTNFRTSTLSYRANPASGAQNVTATTTDSARGLIGCTFQDVVGIGATGSGGAVSADPALNLGSIGTNDVAVIHVVWTGPTTLSTPGGTIIASTSEDNHTSALILASSPNWSGALSGSTDWAVSGIVLQGAAAGPTIGTQPTAQTATISEGGTATFTIAATGTGGLTYDWELESGVGSGTYANVADGSGATWTGQAAATLVGTFTATTLTGRRVRCNVTDSNGTVTSTAVTLTVRAGDAITPTSGTTDGSGVETFAFTSDASVSAQAGTFARVQVTAGGVTKTICMRPGA